MTLSLLLAGASAIAQLNAGEHQALRDALFIGNMTESDLDFSRTAFGRTSFPLLSGLVDIPSGGLDQALALEDKAKKFSLSQLIRAISEQGFGDQPITAARTVPKGELVGVPEEAKKPVLALIEAISSANAAIRAATAELTQEERRKLVEGLPQWCVENPRVKFEFVKKKGYAPKELAQLVKKVNLVALRTTAARLAADVEDQLATLERISLTTKFQGKASGILAGVPYEICGKGDDVHSRNDVMLSIDFGGENRYTGRYGAGIGYAGVMINFGSAVSYDVPDASAGVGLLGIGMAYEFATGEANAKAKSLAFGCGIAGVGGFVRKGELSTYRASTLAEGFGAWGTGVLLDVSGDDDYRLGAWGQGAGRMGGVGWLMDRSGRDRYEAGGVLPSSVFERASESNAQGYGAGVDGEEGGVGVLSDLFGDDEYICSDRGQGAGANGGAGLLIDHEGDDIHLGFAHCQGYGGSGGGGYSVDYSGDDRYMVTTSACHGNGNDFGIGFLFDRSGNDLFGAQDAFPGTGFDNGTGVALLGQGEHRLTGRPLIGKGGLSLFVDTSGSSRFGEGFIGAGQAVATALQGSVYLLDQDGAVSELPGLRKVPSPGSITAVGPDGMKLLWLDAHQIGEEGQLAADKLVGMGKPALEWLLNQDLDAQDNVAAELVEQLCSTLGSDGKAMLASVIGTKGLGTSKICLDVAAALGGQEFRSMAVKALKNEELQAKAILACARCDATDSVPDLMILSASQNRKVAVRAIEALAVLGDVQAFSTAQILLGGGELPVRRAAFELICGFKPNAYALATQLLEGPEEARIRTGLMLMGRIGTPAAIQSVATKLSDPRDSIRLQALLSLAGKCPPELRPKALALQQDKNRMVRAAAARIDLGR